MDISSVNSDLIRGNVTTIILGCLLKNDKYGYEILKEIEDKSTGQYALKQATLYNQLKRLEKQGLVTSYDGSPDDTGGGQRRYYSLTPEGRAYLSKERSEYEYSRTILDKLVSASEFDFTNPTPFDASELRPYSKRDSEEKPKVVYKDKIVEVERKVYLDRYGNEVADDEVDAMKQQAAADDERARIKEEELVSAREQLRKSEEDRIQAEEKLRQIEQRERDEQVLREREFERQRQEAERLAAEQRAAEAARPRRTLDEIFASIDAQRAKEEEDKRRSEEEEARQKAEEEKNRLLLEEEEERDKEPPARRQPSPAYEERVFLPAEPASPQPTSQSSLRDILRRLDERNSDMDASPAPTPVDAPAQSKRDNVRAEVSRKDNFEYENTDVNYRDFFFSIADRPEEHRVETEHKPTPRAESDLKTRLYAKGYKLRQYDRGNTSEYYLNNFLHANRINRDTFLIVLAVFLVEMVVLWTSLYTRINYLYFLSITLVGTALCLIPTVIYLINPARRTRANFNFKLSILNRTMLFIELAVVCILIGFFALGASVNDLDLILCSIVIPSIVLLNLPISSIIYWLLYRTRKYHVSA